MNTYYRTYQDGTSSIHLEGIGDSYTLCGLDTAGDDLVHEHPPEKLPTGRHPVTCVQCQDIIKLVCEHVGINRKR